MRDEVRLALEAPRWAWRFYRRHLALVVGLSLLPSVQRLGVVNWEERIPSVAATLSEVVVMAVRILLVVLIWRLAVRRPDWGRGKAFVDTHWRSLIVQGGLLTLAFLVFDVVAEQVVGGLLPESAQQTYLAVLLFVKNPTVIAFTFIWMVGVVRQAVHRGDDPADGNASAERRAGSAHAPSVRASDSTT
jgi:hypothetical protein